MISFSINCCSRGSVLNCLRNTDGASPRYPPDGSSALLHCFAGLQCANVMATDNWSAGMCKKSFGARQVGNSRGDSESTAH